MASFKEAFAAARKAQGANGTFTWNGKSYSTKQANDPKSSAKGVKPPEPIKTTTIAPSGVQLAQDTMRALGKTSAGSGGSKPSVMSDSPTMQTPKPTAQVKAVAVKTGAKTVVPIGQSPAQRMPGLDKPPTFSKGGMVSKGKKPAKK